MTENEDGVDGREGWDWWRGVCSRCGGERFAPLEGGMATRVRITMKDDCIKIIEWPGRVDGSVKSYRCMQCKSIRKGYFEIIEVGEYEDAHSSEGDPEY